MKVLKIAGMSILALGLVLGIALPVLAAPDSASPQASNMLPKVLKGKVVSIDENQEYFVIQSGEQELTILVDNDTKYYKLSVPGRIVALAQHRVESRHQNQEELEAPACPQMKFRLRDQQQMKGSSQYQIKLRPQNHPGNVDAPELKQTNLKRLHPLGDEAEFSDIAVGDKVAVWIPAGEDGYLAGRVLIIEPVTYARVSGTIIVVSPEDGTIAIAPDDGEAITLYYNEGTVFILKGVIQVETGQSALAIYDSDNMIAKRVVVNQ
ncbi:MAG: hypothetical protein OEZ00_02600 [Dehalococcoidia bacterium]|nr:hypothetical protein [Dehalococcoidia bacterium]